MPGHVTRSAGTISTSTGVSRRSDSLPTARPTSAYRPSCNAHAVIERSSGSMTQYAAHPADSVELPFDPQVEASSTRREHLDGKQWSDRQIARSQRSPRCDQQIGLQHGGWAENDVERRREQALPSRYGWQQALDELHLDQLMTRTRRRGHDQNPVDEFMSPPIVRERIEVRTRERRP